MTLPRKAVLAAALYAVATPVTVGVGFAFGAGNWTVAVPLLAALLVIDFSAVLVWIEAVRDDARRESAPPERPPFLRAWEP